MTSNLTTSFEADQDTRPPAPPPKQRHPSRRHDLQPHTTTTRRQHDWEYSHTIARCRYHKCTTCGKISRAGMLQRHNQVGCLGTAVQYPQRAKQTRHAKQAWEHWHEALQDQSIHCLILARPHNSEQFTRWACTRCGRHCATRWLSQIHRTPCPLAPPTRPARALLEQLRPQLDIEGWTPPLGATLPQAYAEATHAAASNNAAAARANIAAHTAAARAPRILRRPAAQRAHPAPPLQPPTPKRQRRC